MLTVAQGQARKLAFCKKYRELILLQPRSRGGVIHCAASCLLSNRQEIRFAFDFRFTQSQPTQSRRETTPQYALGDEYFKIN